MIDRIKTRPLKPALILLLILLPQFRPVFAQAGNSVNGLQQGVGREADSSLPDDFEGEDGAVYDNDDEIDDDESDI